MCCVRVSKEEKRPCVREGRTKYYKAGEMLREREDAEWKLKNGVAEPRLCVGLVCGWMYG